MPIFNCVKRALTKRRRRRRFQTQTESFESRVMLSSTTSLSPSPEAFKPPVGPFAEIEFYSIDGTGNNLANLDQGSTEEQLLRLVSVNYSDGISSPAGEDLPSAREVSNAVAAQEESILNDRHLTDYIWIWGQFIDHDLDLSEGAEPAESFNIQVPTGDVFFDPYGTGTQEISLHRTVYDEETGDSTANPRQQINQITAFLDGSVVYGSDEERANALRSFESGRLLVSDGDLLPFNEDGLANAGGDSDTLFLAGDVRANENIVLSSMHTIWVREHNRIADEITARNPNLSDQEIYLQVRAIVTAELQAITYNEFLPALLGEDAIAKYQGYDPNVDASIANIFSTAAYRLGHSLLSSELLRLDENGNVIEDGNIALQDAFFNPQELVDEGIDSLLQGAAAQKAQELDNFIIDDVRNFLFGPPGAGGFDLASLNIQRGRDHGLPSYNQAHIDLGLEPAESFADISSDPGVQERLASVYESVDDVDVWVGGLAEDHVAGSSTGELFRAVLVDQFTRIRDGDRLWYQNQFSGSELRKIERTTLADIIERNSDVTDLQQNIFFAEGPGNREHGRFNMRKLQRKLEARERRAERRDDRQDNRENRQADPSLMQHVLAMLDLNDENDKHDSASNRRRGR